MKTIKQTGLLFEIKPTDYILGYNSPLSTEEINKEGDWEKYLPEGEIQNKPFIFDTLSCATFSGTNVVETILKYMLDNNLLGSKEIKFLEDLKVLKNGQFNFSDRFSAIMSGTTKRGNTLQNVWHSFRHRGLLAEEYLPFDSSFKTWEEYHNPASITKDMLDKAKKILDLFDFSYEWVQIGKDQMPNIKPALKVSPLHAGIPTNATHGVMIYKDGFYFNSYDPFKKKYKGVGFSLRGIVTMKELNKELITQTLRQGSRGGQVKILQRKLNITDDGIFGRITRFNVVLFQTKNFLVPDGIVGPKTREVLNKI